MKAANVDRVARPPIEEYTTDAMNIVCTMGTLGMFRPNKAPIEACAVIDVSWP